MLDDMNVLNQFSVETFLGTIFDDSFSFSLIDLNNLPHKNRRFNKIYLVSDRTNIAFELLKSYLNEREPQVKLQISNQENLKLSGRSNLVLVDQTLDLASLTKNQSNSSAWWVSFNQNPAKSKVKQTNLVVKNEINQLVAILQLLIQVGVIKTSNENYLEAVHEWLKTVSRKWQINIVTEHNETKQLAVLAAGKTSLFLAADKNKIVAQTFQIMLAKLAKNVAFAETIENIYYNHASGWFSHPVEKPYAVFDLMSSADTKTAKKAFFDKNRLLSGRMPASFEIKLKGTSDFERQMFGYFMASFMASYLAVLNKQNLMKKSIFLSFTN